MSEMRYGDNRTIHRSESLDVEVDAAGEVVSVWFRCLALPFRQSLASAERGAEMRRMYQDKAGVRPLKAVVVEEAA